MRHLLQPAALALLAAVAIACGGDQRDSSLGPAPALSLMDGTWDYGAPRPPGGACLLYRLELDGEGSEFSGTFAEDGVNISFAVNSNTGVWCPAFSTVGELEDFSGELAQLAGHLVRAGRLNGAHVSFQLGTGWAHEGEIVQALDGRVCMTGSVEGQLGGQDLDGEWAACKR